MFRLSFLKEKDVFLDINERNKLDAVYQLINRPDITRKEEIFKAVCARERLETTCIADGIALPHVRTGLVNKLIIKLAIFANGIQSDALDKKCIKFMFLIVAPESDMRGYLRTLSHIVRVMCGKGVKEALLKANTKKEVLKILWGK